MVKANLVIGFLFLFIGLNTFAQINECGNYLGSKSISKAADWRTAETLIAFEVLTATELAKHMRTVKSGPLFKLEQHKPKTKESVLNHSEYSIAKESAVIYLRNLYNPFYDMNPVVTKFFGKDFVNRLRSLWFHAENRSKIDDYLSDNIDAILVNAVLLPQLSRMQRIAFTLKQDTAPVIAAGMAIAGMGAAAGLGILAAGSLIDEGIGGLIGLMIGGQVAAYGVGGGAILILGGISLTPFAYVENRSIPGYSFGLYDLEIGRHVRNQYSN